MMPHWKKILVRHRLSGFLSLLWACAGYALFVWAIVPTAFPPIVELWHTGWPRIVPLFSGLACSTFLVVFFMASARQFPYSNRYEVLVSFSLATNALLLLVLAATRQYYSVMLLCCFVVFQILWLGMEVFYRARFVKYRFAVFPASIKMVSEDFPEYRITFTYSGHEMENNNVDAIIVEDENSLSEEWAKRLAYGRSMNIPVIPLAFFLENIWGRVPLEVMGETPDICRAFSNWYMVIKTITDKLLALFGLVLLSPFFVFIAVVLKATSREPVLFRQERVGFNDCVFVMYKFRTMQSAPDLCGPDSGERQITAFGGFLRKFHLDELPQLFNVLRGDLTLVGPRPETPELTKCYRSNIPLYNLRTKVNQGVVGWALIHQGNVCGIEDTAIKLSYDLYYMKRASVFLDAYIIVKSVWLMLFGIEKVKSPHKLGLFS